jgi:hypothetical protein
LTFHNISITPRLTLPLHYHKHRQSGFFFRHIYTYTNSFQRKGEKTAQVLESNLTSLEKKIDDLLASFEEAERRKVDGAKDNKHVLAGGASSEKGDDSTEKP